MIGLAFASDVAAHPAMPIITWPRLALPLHPGTALVARGRGATGPNRVTTYSVTARFTFRPLAPLLPAFQSSVTERTKVRY